GSATPTSPAGWPPCTTAGRSDRHGKRVPHGRSMSDLAAFFRLLGALWVLVRADALLPRALDPYLPPTARLLAKFLRLFAGPQARRGREGERLAVALERLGPVSIKLGQLLSTRADIFGQV